MGAAHAQAGHIFIRRGKKVITCRVCRRSAGDKNAKIWIYPCEGRRPDQQQSQASAVNQEGASSEGQRDAQETPGGTVIENPGAEWTAQPGSRESERPEAERQERAAEVSEADFPDRFRRAVVEVDAPPNEGEEAEQSNGDSTQEVPDVSLEDAPGQSEVERRLAVITRERQEETRQLGEEERPAQVRKVQQADAPTDSVVQLLGWAHGRMKGRRLVRGPAETIRPRARRQEEESKQQQAV